jgi:hypothetical protein
MSGFHPEKKKIFGVEVGVAFSHTLYTKNKSSTIVILSPLTEV